MQKTEARTTSTVIQPPVWQCHAWFWGIAILGVILDLWSKYSVFAWMNAKGIDEYKLIEGFLSVVMRENAGAAFGIAEGQRILLIVFAATAMAGITGYLIWGRIRDKVMCAALGLFMGGAAGNLYDRLFNNGMVRDFIDVHWRGWHWPAFNVADSLLCIAMGIFLAKSFLTGRPS
ncbi:MAG TPA: signal peptidase II [Sedimentisphaerales bacterium]|nr:signal peptidase II [Sedimentisphaerales bacterium]